MISLKDIQKREKAATNILLNYLNQTPCPIEIEDAKLLVSCIKDLRDLYLLVDDLGMESLRLLNN